jgi:hypothetical protein
MTVGTALAIICPDSPFNTCELKYRLNDKKMVIEIATVVLRCGILESLEAFGGRKGGEESRVEKSLTQKIWAVWGFNGCDLYRTEGGIKVLYKY